MKILVINAGSSSIKYQLFEMERRSALAQGDVSRIGMSAAVLTHKPHDRPRIKIGAEILDHIQAIEYILTILVSPNHGVIKDKSEIDAIGHRFVHGGEYFPDSVLITKENLPLLRDCIELAPLHNPHNLRGINACSQMLPGVPQVAVFDTALYRGVPEYAYLYAIPYKLYRKYSIRRYGFHGTSHFYVSRRAAALLGKPLEELRMITAHLGNGASMTAFKNGVAIDTSMGFTPLEGLVMGTRSGDLDPAVILHVMAREELTLHEANTLLNKHSGLLGVSGISSDMKDIVEDMSEGNDRAKMAFDVFCYRLRKYIGSYAAVLGGLDCLVFTAGIGENSPEVRKSAVEGLEFLGLKIDDERNSRQEAPERIISKEGSPAAIAVIATNEELVIASDTFEIAQKLKSGKRE